MVVSRGGIVATESPLASQAGAMILAQGGNAIDAAVAANAVVGVVEPMMNGMGGDLFVIFYEAKTGKLYGLNASGWAPAKLSIEFLHGKGDEKMPQHGINSVTVPGVVDGWSKLLSRFGNKKFPEVLAPAIHYAKDGFPVPELDAQYWSEAAEKLHADPNAAATFLPAGNAPKLGDIFRNPDLAHSLQEVADGGRDAFYKGDIANRIVATSTRLGGTMSSEDLADFSSEWVEPISTTYRDWTVYEIPPNGQGIAALEMLNIMETFPLKQFQNTADAPHVMIEAKKLAYADMYRYVADQKFSSVPVAGMLSKEYAAQRAKLIDMAKANCDVGPGNPEFATKGDTMYLSVVDRDGNMVSLIQSNYSWLRFRSGRGRHRLRSPKPRRPLQPGSKIAERARRPQAASSHHHPRLHDARPGTHRLRHHGRLQPVASARTIRIQCRGLWDEHSSRAGSAQIHKIYFHWLRRDDGRPLSR